MDMTGRDMSGMDMPGMDMPGMEDTTEPVTSTAAADMAGMTGMPDMSSDAASSTALPPASGTFTLLAAAASETTHSEEAAVSSSAAQMGSMTSMSGMSNSFHFGVGDTLWTTSLTPTNGQGYTGAIFLLILMAFSLRLLSTVRGMTEKHWKPKTPTRCHDDEADNYLKMGQLRSDEANVSSGHRWNTTIQLTRALFQLTTMTMGYLLMLAVMTFNLGYLLAILAGGFLGELTLGWIQH